MPSVFNSEEERLAYLISLNSTDAMRQLKEFIAGSNSSVQALERLTKVTMEYARIAKISFNSAKMSMAELNAAYKQAVASGNALTGGMGGAGGLGGIGGLGGLGGVSSWGGGAGSGGAGVINQIPPAVNRAKSALGSLATTFRHVIVGMLAFRVIQFFLDIVRGIGEATTAAKEFYKSLINIEIGLRSMQRNGVDVTFADAARELKELQRLFPIFSSKELMDGLDNIINKTKEMGLTWEQTTLIWKIAAATQAKTGKSMENVSDAIINAMTSSSGNMTKTLNEQANLYINSQDILAKARELGIESIDGTVSGLTKEERAIVVLTVAYEQLLTQMDDINASMELAPNLVDTQTAAWTNFKTAMGLVFLEFQSKIAPYMTTFFRNLTVQVGLVSKLIVYGFIGWMPSFIMGMGGVLEALRSGKNILKGFSEGFSAIWTGIDDLVKKASDPAASIENAFGELGTGAGEAFSEGLTTEQQEALDDFERNIEEMALDIQRKLEQDLIDLGRQFADIDVDYKRQLEEIIKDYNRGVADANEAAMESIANANEKYRENELKAEDDYQRQLQRLRDEFLFDLEDALRAQDAGQIRRLIRRYQLDKKNIVKEGDEQREARRKNLADELADIEKQRQRKLADLLEEQNDKRLKAVEDWQRDRVDAQTKFDQDQEDEKRRNAYKLQDLVDALAEQGLATLAGAEAIRAILTTYFGPGGYTDQIYNYFIAKITAAAAIANTFARMGQPGFEKTKMTPIGPVVPMMASGGAMIASRPTTAVFGEGGEPELAVFLPLSKLKAPTARSSLTSNGGAGGKIKLEVLLSPDLEARIIQQAANNVAATITRIQREK